MLKITKMLSLILSLCAIMLLFSCNSQKIDKEPEIKFEEKTTTLSIMTTNDFLKNTVKSIVGDKHVIESIFSNNNFIDQYNFSEDTYKNIAKQDIFFYLGVEYEPYTEDLINKIERKNLSLVNTSRGANILSNEKKEVNPYYFYSINNYKSILLNIKNSVEENDTKNRDFYENNFKELVKKIDEINTQIKDLQSNLKDTVIIYSEERFDYLINDYKIDKVLLPKNFDGNNPVSVNNLKQTIADGTKDKKHIIYLYCDDNELNKYQGILQQNNINIVKFDALYNDFIPFMENMIKLIK